MVGPLRTVQAMLKQGHGELLGAGDLISQFRVETVSFFGVVGNKGLSATRSKGASGFGSALGGVRRVGSAPEPLHQGGEHAPRPGLAPPADGLWRTPSAWDGQAPWGLLLAHLAVRRPDRPLPGLLAR